MKNKEEKQIERNCDNCKRHHTKYCPNRPSDNNR